MFIPSEKLQWLRNTLHTINPEERAKHDELLRDPEVKEELARMWSVSSKTTVVDGYIYKRTSYRIQLNEDTNTIELVKTAALDWDIMSSVKLSDIDVDDSIYYDFAQIYIPKYEQYEWPVNDPHVQRFSSYIYGQDELNLRNREAYLQRGYKYSIHHFGYAILAFMCEGAISYTLLIKFDEATSTITNVDMKALDDLHNVLWLPQIDLKQLVHINMGHGYHKTGIPDPQLRFITSKGVLLSNVFKKD